MSDRKSRAFLTVFAAGILLLGGPVAQTTNASRMLGVLTDKSGAAVSSDISVFYAGSSSLQNQTSTSPSGSYSMVIDTATSVLKDARYSINGFYIAGFWIKTLSADFSSDVINLLQRVTGYQSLNRVQFTVDTEKAQEFRIYSTMRPNVILQNGEALREAASIADIGPNSWFFSQSESIIYVQVVPSAPSTSTTSTSTTSTSTTVTTTTTTLPETTTTLFPTTTTLPILVYHEDFESANVVDEHTLDIEIGHRFEFEGEGGAAMRIGTDFARSGGRCVEMELTDISSSKRNQFELTGVSDYVGDEMYSKAWLYLPPGWGVDSGSSDNWYTIATIYQENGVNGYPYMDVKIKQPDPAQTKYNVEVSGKDVYGDPIVLGQLFNFPLRRGSWFSLDMYLVRHETNGAVRVVMDDYEVVDKENVATKSGDTWSMSIAKIHYDPADTDPHKIWVDDVSLYAGVPLELR